MFHLAACVFLGAVPNGPDNVLIDGRIIDEDDWDFAARWIIDIDGPEKVNIDDPEAFFRGELRVTGDTFHSIARVIDEILKCHRKIEDHGTNSELAMEWFLSSLEALQKGLRKKWELAAGYSALPPEKWSSHLKSAGLQVKLKRTTEPGRYFYELDFLLKESERPSNREVTHRLTQVPFSGEDSNQLSSTIGEWVGLHAPVLPVTVNSKGEILPNRMKKSEYVQKILEAWPLLKKFEHEIFVKCDNNLQLLSETQKECCPVFAKIDLGRSCYFSLPLPKVTIF